MMKYILLSLLAIQHFGNAFTQNAFTFSHLHKRNLQMMDRSSFIQNLVTQTSIFSLASRLDMTSQSSTSFVTPSSRVENDNEKESNEASVAYRSMSIPMEAYDTQIPVALWYPISTKSKTSISDLSTLRPAKYDHAISIPRIGQLLASITFLPSFLKKKYPMDPTMNKASDKKVVVVDGTDIPLPSAEDKVPVIFLAHGYLGSRFDLSHLAESLAQQGFLCVSPEYPESLAASYERQEGLDRGQITDKILQTLFSSSSSSTKFGIIGHSLGCGTATNTGDKSWVRVTIAGPPGERPDTLGGDILFIASVNDGAVTMARLQGLIPSDFVVMSENDERVKSTVVAYKSNDDYSSSTTQIPRRTAIIFQNDDSPNHISFLADSVNNAMIDLLSPLLPVAQALSIPVLDFDKYKSSQDSEQTAEVVIPLVSSYLRQRMM